MDSCADPEPDRFDELCDQMVERCRRAGYVAPYDWVRWLLRLEIEAAAHRDGVVFDQAARAMTLDHVSSLADELVEVTSQAEARVPACEPRGP